MSDDDITLRLRWMQLKEFLTGSKEAEKAIKGVRDAQGRLRDEHGRFVGEADRADRSAKRLTGSVKGLRDSYHGLSKVMGLVGGASLGSALTGGSLYAFKQASNLQQTTLAYETMLKSQTQATQMVADLRKFAKDTPFEFTDVATAGQKLLAFGADASQVTSILTTLGDASAGLNMGSEGLSRLSVIFGQIASKGLLQGDEALQLAEAGISVYDILAKQLKMTPAQVRKLGEQSKLSSGTVIPLILKGMDEQFGGLMGKQSKTLGGSMSNLKDTVTQALTDAVMPYVPQITRWVVGLTGDIPSLARRVQGLIRDLVDAARRGRDFYYRLRDIAATQGAKRLLRDVGDALGWIKDTLASVLSPVGRLIGFLNDPNNTGKVGDDLDRIAAFCENPAVQATLKGIAVYATAMWSFNSATRATAGAMALLKGSMGFLGVGAGAGAGAGGAAAAGRFSGLAPMAAILAGAGTAGYFLSKKTGGKWDEDVDRLRQSWSEADGAGGKTLAFIKWVGGEIWRALTDPVAGFFTSWFTKEGKGNQALLGWFKSVGQGLTDAFKSAVNWLIDAINGLRPSLPFVGQVGPSIPHLARGGDVAQGGLVGVGEAGREILALPRGASVIPRQRAMSELAAAGAGGYHQHPIEIDGREIMRVTHRHEDRAGGRL